MTRVAILAYDHSALFELGCAVELFALPRPEFPRWYNTEVVSFDAGPLRSTGNVRLQVKKIRGFEDYDMLVIPSWRRVEPGIPAVLKKAMLELYNRGGRIVTFCSGAFCLAETGLLDGREATTHWKESAKFRRRFPAVRYVGDVLFVYGDRLGCSAGSAAGLDLGLHIIREDHGYEIANQVARRLVLSAHRSGGQSQFVDTPVAAKPDGFAQTLDWALGNLGENIDIDRFARQANMSRRTFDRKFRASMAMTPKAWLTQQRLEHAKRLLESTSDSIERIAGLAGFDNATTLRHHFRRQFRLSPSRFREQFGRKGTLQQGENSWPTRG